jgi:RNA polymerase sigma-54 factor
MADMLKQGLVMKQTQKLSPLQIQTIKLIELPIQELEQKIRDELDENPVLDDTPQEKKDDDQEEARDVSIDEMKDDSDQVPYYNLHVNNYGKDERPQYNTFSVKESFRQSLMDQLGFRNLGKHQHDVASFIIGSLDDDGYLRRDIDSIVDDLAFKENIETNRDEVLQMLKVIQDFEPTGVGARNLQECLLLQLKAMKQTPEVKNAERIIQNHFDEFSNKHFQKIISKLGPH